VYEREVAQVCIQQILQIKQGGCELGAHVRVGVGVCGRGCQGECGLVSGGGRGQQVQKQFLGDGA
jgi:hypothetical protein